MSKKSNSELALDSVDQMFVDGLKDRLIRIASEVTSSDQDLATFKARCRTAFEVMSIARDEATKIVSES